MLTHVDQAVLRTRDDSLALTRQHGDTPRATCCQDKAEPHPELPSRVHQDSDLKASPPFTEPSLELTPGLLYRGGSRVHTERRR